MRQRDCSKSLEFIFVHSMSENHSHPYNCYHFFSSKTADKPHPAFISTSFFLNQLLEGSVDRRADFCSLVEVDGGHSSFADTFGREFEFLHAVLVTAPSNTSNVALPCIHPCKLHWHQICSIQTARGYIAPSLAST